MLDDVSVIVPVAENEDKWQNLIEDLQKLPSKSEVIFVSANSEFKDSDVFENFKDLNYRVIESDPGRARTLNAGAMAATRDYFWFLHADSRFSYNTLSSLERSLKIYPNRINYFNLRFLNDGPPLIFFNELGAKIRSLLFGIPFGDQGFCISRGKFNEIGGYPEEAKYGEDHLFVWYAKRLGIGVHCTGGTLLTSAREYKDKGWLKLTLNRQYLWFKQAIPELKKFLTKKVF